MKTGELKEIQVKYIPKTVTLPDNKGLPTKIRQARDVYRLYSELMNEITERFLCLHLTQKNELLCFEIIAIGTQTAALVDVRVIYRSALLSTATRLIFVHNHPSGVPDPSPEDVELTRQLVDAGKLFNIEVVDHVIIGDKKRGYFSFAERGLL